MKKNHLDILLAGSNLNRCNNLASRLRYQGHKVDLIDNGFQILNEIEKSNSGYNVVLFLGDELDDMQAMEAISHLRVVRSPNQLFIIHIVSNRESIDSSLQNGCSLALANDNFNQILAGLDQAEKVIK